MKIRLSHSDIIFENNTYIAINKQRGWPCHKTLDPNRSNLFDALQSYLKNRDGAPQYLSLLHRLDVNTSGVILFCKEKSANKVLADIFNNHKATKTYIAVTNGAPDSPNGRMEDFLLPKKINKIQKMTKVFRGGQKAITDYNLLESKGKLSLVEYSLLTGRMHQIRVQSALRGFPILGDDLYGNKNKNYKGQLLHALKLEFFDPISEENILISTEIPKEFLDAFNGIRKQEANNFTYVAFNKPYGVLCQFTGEKGDRTLADFNLPKNIYPAGRLDKDSEGLLILTDDGKFIDKLLKPSEQKNKTYIVQVEGSPTKESLRKLERGVKIQNYQTRPCKVSYYKDGDKIEERDPPIRKRKNIPTTWLEITLHEGKNRQVRKMTAKVGHPTLRLIRKSVGKFKMKSLKPECFIQIKKEDVL